MPNHLTDPPVVPELMQTQATSENLERELIKLLDEAGRVIGVYTASEARKKSEALGLDMVLMSEKSSPIICKAVDFRMRTINRFFD